MHFELDHVLICTHVDAPEADHLVDFGLTEGLSNVHFGQGRGHETSPFGICLRPRSPETDLTPFSTWAYRPAYVPESMVMRMGENASVVTDPLLFYKTFG